MIKQLQISFQDLSYIMLALFLITLIIMSVNGSTEPNYELLIEVEVSEGDTLWAIASNYAEDMSTQSFISLLRAHNDLEHDMIYPGQKLLVPQLDSQRVVTNESDYLLSSKH